MDTARILSGKCLSEAWGLLRGRVGEGQDFAARDPGAWFLSTAPGFWRARRKGKESGLLDMRRFDPWL